MKIIKSLSEPSWEEIPTSTKHSATTIKKNNTGEFTVQCSLILIAEVNNWLNKYY